MIDSEDDVRAWVRVASKGKARWVEPALGSTPGLPDCWVPFGVGERANNSVVQLELKAGNIKAGHLCYEVRPEQRREIRALLKDEVPVGMLIGVKGTQTFLFALCTVEVLDGKLPMDSLNRQTPWIAMHKDQLSRFWEGVNFIFSYFRGSVV